MTSIRDLSDQMRKAEESGAKRAAQVMEVENQLNAIMTEMQRLEPTQRFNRSGLPTCLAGHAAVAATTLSAFSADYPNCLMAS